MESRLEYTEDSELPAVAQALSKPKAICLEYSFGGLNLGIIMSRPFGVSLIAATKRSLKRQPVANRKIERAFKFLSLIFISFALCV